LVIFFSSMDLWSLDMGMSPYPTDTLMLLQDMHSKKKPKDIEKAIEDFQAQMLKELFLKSFFTDSGSFLTEEEREEGVATLAEAQLVQNRMLDYYSRELAKKDILKIKKLLLKGMTSETGQTQY